MGCRCDHHVQRAVHQLVERVLRPRHHETDGDTRIVAQHALHQQGHQTDADQRSGADAQVIAKTDLEALHLLRRDVHVVRDRAAFTGQRFTEGRAAHAVSAALEQRRARLHLQRRHVARQGRLRHEQVFGGRGDRTLLENHGKLHQMFRIHQDLIVLIAKYRFY